MPFNSRLEHRRKVKSGGNSERRGWTVYRCSRQAPEPPPTAKRSTTEWLAWGQGRDSQGGEHREAGALLSSPPPGWTPAVRGYAPSSSRLLRTARDLCGTEMRAAPDRSAAPRCPFPPALDLPRDLDLPGDLGPGALEPSAAPAPPLTSPRQTCVTWHVVFILRVPENNRVELKIIVTV